MHKAAKSVLIIIVALLVAGLAYHLIPIGGLIYYMHAQMKAGQKYMDSLTDEDIQVWIKKSVAYMEEYDPNSHGWQDYGPAGKLIPDELKELKILRIDIFPDSVSYVWLGGMDHTYLEVRRTTDGAFEVTANYNDYSSKLLWPKQEAAP